MNAELFLLGRRVDMGARARRRWLVVLIYAMLAALMTGFWFLDQWRESAIYLILATFLINRFFLGGRDFGGLIKPFNGKPPRGRSGLPSDLALVLRIYRPEPREDEYLNDEREVEQRGQAHYQAYRALASAVFLLWATMNLHTNVPRLLERLSISIDTLRYGLATATVLASLTLPQAILLWTEPDMEEDAVD
jgi:hypothetical protein